MKDLTIITVNYRNWDKLSRCLDALANIPANYFSFEVIVVDNFSQDGKLSKFREMYPHFSFILNKGNYGTANGNNLGAANASGKYLLFLNPATIVSERTLLAMLDQAKAGRANSIVSCRQFNPDGSEIKHYGKFPSAVTLSGWTRFIPDFLKIKEELRYNERFIFPECVSGSVIMMSRSSFNAIGKWNERFWIFFEDIDFCRRARDLGGTIFLLRNFSVTQIKDEPSMNDLEALIVAKSERNISRHEYISIHENGVKEVVIHTFLVLNNLIYGMLLALPGLVLIFNKNLLSFTRSYIRLLNYYFKAFLHDTWISPRSAKHPEAYRLSNNAEKKLVTIVDDKPGV